MKYEQVFIKSESDLPKEVGNYHVMLKNGSARLFHYPFKGDVGYNVIKSDWLSAIEYYLQPLPEQTERKEEVIRILNNLIPMAEDAIKLYEKSGSHQEFIKDDREEIREAKTFVNELKSQLK